MYETKFKLPGDALTPEQIKYIQERLNLKPLYEAVVESALKAGIKPKQKEAA